MVANDKTVKHIWGAAVFTVVGIGLIAIGVVWWMAYQEEWDREQQKLEEAAERSIELQRERDLIEHGFPVSPDEKSNPD